MAEKKKQKKKKKHWLLRYLFRLQLLTLLLIVVVVSYYYIGGYAKQVRAMKEEAERIVRASSEESFKTSQTGFVYAADGTEISKLKGEKDSYYVQIEDIPAQAAAAIISIEDKKFYQHNGIDYKALLRALKAMLENGEVTQGGSTITMQLSRNIFLTQERSWQRKVEEMFISLELEKKYEKDDILEFYLNNIYFGNGYYGIQAASRGYFNRDIWDLNLSEIAFLCAVPNNPTLYDPLTNMENTLSRRDRILNNMLEDGKISKQDYTKAIGSEIVLERPPKNSKNDYVETYAYYCATRALMQQQGFTFQSEFSNAAEEEAYEEAYSAMYNECQRMLYSGGYSIYTSLDLNLQTELQAAVDSILGDFTDVNEEGVYKLQSSAVCIDNNNGYVKAIVGGRSQDFAGYTLNRAYQSFRQPGSAIKPLIVYTPMLERGYNADTYVVDEPVEDGPKNANGTYLGRITLRTAVEKSVNVVAWKLFDELTPEVGLGYLKEMNFSHLDKEDYRLPSALGGFTRGVSALEMASAYAALENDGIYRTPTCIVKILDDSGSVIYASDQTGKSVYRQNAARAMTDILTGVLTAGTAKGLALSHMPCAGKTGTTNDLKDGWFVGYTRYYTTSVWVGFDMPEKLSGLAGSSYPGKIWRMFMEKAHENLQALEFLPAAELSGDYNTPPLSQDESEGVFSGEGAAEEVKPSENMPQQEEPLPEESVPEASLGGEPAQKEETGQEEEAVPEEPDQSNDVNPEEPEQGSGSAEEEEIP